MSIKKISGYSVKLSEILGKGSFGSVYRGEQDGTKKVCAIKILEKQLIDSDDYLKAALFSQIQILQLLKSENVVQVMDVMESSKNYYIIQELCDGDLQKYIKEHKGISEERAIEFLKQLCNGFLALVKEGIVHRDLKPANIMLSKGVIKIGDFGFAKKNVNKRMKNVSSVGTPLYMSLQVLKSQPYTSKCDVWATGFIFYELLHGRTPWTANTEFELVKNISTKPLQINPSLSPATKDFLTKCLKTQENDRLSWDQVFFHPIFQNFFAQYAQQNKQFEDKLKQVMTKLRFEINSKNLDLQKLLQQLGFKVLKQLSFKQFSDFIRHICPEISKDQITFFFEKLDDNASGTIDISELSTQMQKHRISFKSNTDPIEMLMNRLSVKKAQTLLQSETFIQSQLSNELQIKAKICFIKLYKIISAKQLRLYQVFDSFDQNQSGNMSIFEFEKLLKTLDKSFNQQQIYEVFNYLDQDMSNSIQFDELNSYYCKVNGLSQALHSDEKKQSQSKRKKIFNN